MKTLSFPLLATLACCIAGCEVPGTSDDPTDGGHGGGQSGSLVPATCSEVSRIAMSDWSVTPEGADHSAQDVFDVQVGAFAGDYEGQPLSLEIEVTGDPEFVVIEEDDNTTPTGTDPLPGGLPEMFCPPFHWEIPVRITFVSQPDFDEVVDSILVARGPQDGGWGLFLDIDEVQGTSTPDWDVTEWDRTELSIYAGWVEGAWFGGLAWSSSKEADTPNGPASGVVDVSRTFEAGR